MKRFLFLFILFAITGMTAQSYKISPSITHSKPSDFPNSISKAEVYEFKIKKGKVKKDSILIESAFYDKVQNKIHGVMRNYIYYSHGPAKPYFENYEKIYNNKNKLILDIITPVDKKTDRYGYFIEISFPTSITKYIYDDDINEYIEKTYKSVNAIITVDKKNKDTVSEFIYDQEQHFFYEYDDNKLQYTYSSKDSIVIKSKNHLFDTIMAATEVDCRTCYTKRRDSQNVYIDNLKKIMISYTEEGGIHSKKYFFYDDHKRVLKQIDSTGWIHKTIQPYQESETTYRYNANGFTKQIKNFKTEFSASSKNTIIYNDKGYIISDCYYYTDEEKCTFFEYIYHKDKVVQIIEIDNDGKKIFTYFKYNKHGLVTEEKDVINDKIINLLRYYYR